MISQFEVKVEVEIISTIPDLKISEGWEISKTYWKNNRHITKAFTKIPVTAIDEKNAKELALSKNQLFITDTSQICHVIKLNYQQISIQKI
jgi:hypothetical protein